MFDRSLSPPHVSDADKPLRREVAMAYRTALEARRSHHAALDAAEAVYYQARPEAMSDPLAASARINEMIASAIRVDPEWFWKNVRALIESGQLSSRPDARSENT
jgi:hypothetical protein